MSLVSDGLNVIDNIVLQQAYMCINDYNESGIEVKINVYLQLWIRMSLGNKSSNNVTG